MVPVELNMIYFDVAAFIFSVTGSEVEGGPAPSRKHRRGRWDNLWSYRYQSNQLFFSPLSLYFHKTNKSQILISVVKKTESKECKFRCIGAGGWKSILRDKNDVNDVIVTGDVDPVELLRCLEKWFRTDVLSARLIEMA